jgi:hypothetical protein
MSRIQLISTERDSFGCQLGHCARDLPEFCHFAFISCVISSFISLFCDAALWCGSMNLTLCPAVRLSRQRMMHMQQATGHSNIASTGRFKRSIVRGRRRRRRRRSEHRTGIITGLDHMSPKPGQFLPFYNLFLAFLM